MAELELTTGLPEPRPPTRDTRARKTLERALRRVERRLRVGRIVDLSTTSLAVALVGLAATLLLHKLGMLPPDGWRLLGSAPGCSG